MRMLALTLCALAVVIVSVAVVVDRGSERVSVAAGSAPGAAAPAAPPTVSRPPLTPSPTAPAPSPSGEVLFGEPDYDLGGYSEEEVAVAARALGVELGIRLEHEAIEGLVADGRERLAPPLEVAGLDPDAALDRTALVEAAQRLAIPVAEDPTAADLKRLAASAREMLRPVLVVLGIDPGDVVDPADLRGAASRLGLSGPVTGGVLNRLAAMARWRLAPAVWTAGRDLGERLDPDDLVELIRTLGRDPGTRVDPTDTDRLVDAGSAGLSILSSAPVHAGLEHVRMRARLPGGEAEVNVLRWRLDDPRVEVRTEATTALGRRASIPDVARSRMPAGAVAAVNGGFWLEAGDPDGLLVTDGELLSDATMGMTWTRGRRGGFGLHRNRATVGRAGGGAHVLAPTAPAPLPLRGVNRALSPDDRDVVAYTPAWGTTTGTAPGTVEVALAGVHLAPDMHETRPVGAVSTGGNLPVPRDGLVLAATGRAGQTLAAMAAQGTLAVQITAPDGWADADQGLSGGPLLVTGGAMTGPTDWLFEGFGPEHNNQRHPRTAVGFTREGEGLLVVVDGRQPGHSNGMTTAETARLLQSLGAAEAVMLDGGGSSHLVVGGRTANRPCCDPTPRPVATAIVFYAR